MPRRNRGVERKTVKMVEAFAFTPDWQMAFAQPHEGLLKLRRRLPGLGIPTRNRAALARVVAMKADVSNCKRNGTAIGGKEPVFAEWLCFDEFEIRAKAPAGFGKGEAKPFANRSQAGLAGDGRAGSGGIVGEPLSVIPAEADGEPEKITKPSAQFGSVAE